MLAIMVLSATLIISVFFPGVLMPGLMFGYMASSISNYEFVTIAYAVAALLLIIVKVSLSSPRFTINEVDVSFFFFLFIYSCTAVYAVDTSSGVKAAIGLLTPAISVYLIARLIGLCGDISQRINEVAFGFVVLGAIFSVLALSVPQENADVQRFTVGDSSAVGMSQPLPYAMLSAAVLALNIKRYRWIVVLICAISIIPILYLAVLNATRGAFIAGGVAFIAFLFIFPRRTRLRNISIAFGGVILTAVYLIKASIDNVAIPSGLERLIDFGSYGGDLDPSSQDRLYLLKNGLDIFYYNFLLGGGIGSYYYTTSAVYPHNLFVEIAAEFGIVGLFLLATTFVVVVHHASIVRIRYMGWQGPFLMSVFILALTHQQFSFNLPMAKGLFFIGLLASMPIERRAVGQPPSGGLARTLDHRAWRYGWGTLRSRSGLRRLDRPAGQESEAP